MLCFSSIFPSAFVGPWLPIPDSYRVEQSYNVEIKQNWDVYRSCLIFFKLAFDVETCCGCRTQRIFIPQILPNPLRGRSSLIVQQTFWLQSCCAMRQCQADILAISAADCVGLAVFFMTFVLHSKYTVFQTFFKFPSSNIGQRFESDSRMLLENPSRLQTSCFLPSQFTCVSDSVRQSSDDLAKWCSG